MAVFFKEVSDGSISGWNSNCQSYIESATALSYEFIARKDSFWQASEIDFHYETKANKVMVDFKFDALYS